MVSLYLKLPWYIRTKFPCMWTCTWLCICIHEWYNKSTLRIEDTELYCFAVLTAEDKNYWLKVCWQPPLPFTPVHRHRLLHIQPGRSAGKHLLDAQKVTAQHININWWQLQLILIVQDKSSQMVSSQLTQTWSRAIILDLVAANSITKEGQATQRNTHFSNLILISSHIRARHLKPHQMKQLSMCCHSNTSVLSFTKRQHTAGIGSTTKAEHGMAEEAGRGTPKTHRCLCLIWAVCVQ